MTYVSDHAVLRSLERSTGIDIEAIRAELSSPAIAVAAENGCDTVLRHDCRLKLHRGCRVDGAAEAGAAVNAC